MATEPTPEPAVPAESDGPGYVRAFTAKALVLGLILSSFVVVGAWFNGLIMGELMAVIITLTIGWIYHLTTGLMPKTMGIFAG